MVGRNDPCPCGSGKKYKKCCYKKDQLERRVAERQKQPGDVLEPTDSIYKVWLEWRAARSRSDFNFMFDLIVPKSELATSVGSRDAFVAACSEAGAPVPTGERADFKHLRIDEGQRADLLQTVGEDDSALSKVRCERIGFSKTDEGWRLSGFEAVEVDKDSESSLGFEVFEPSQPEQAAS